MQISLRFVVRLGTLLALLVSVVSNVMLGHAAPPAQPPIPVHSRPAYYEHFSSVSADAQTFPAALRARAAIAPDPCKTFTYGVNARSVTGTMLYSWAEVVGWCYNGTEVTYTTVSYQPKTSAGWSYEGISGEAIKQYGSKKTFFQARATGKFSYGCMGPAGCMWSRYPWVNIVVYANSTYSGSGNPDERYW